MRAPGGHVCVGYGQPAISLRRWRRCSASDSEAAVSLSLLWRVTGEGMAAMPRDGPGFGATNSPEHWTEIGGETGVRFTGLAIHTTSPDNEARLRAGLAVFRARWVPAVVLIAKARAAGMCQRLHTFPPGRCPCPS